MNAPTTTTPLGNVRMTAERDDSPPGGLIVISPSMTAAAQLADMTLESGGWEWRNADQAQASAGGGTGTVDADTESTTMVDQTGAS
jgi:hypothetical protein